MTLVGNTTFSFTGHTATGASSVTLVIKQDVSGGRVITWPVSKRFSGGVTPPATTAADAVDIWTVGTYDAGTTNIISLAVKDVR